MWSIRRALVLVSLYTLAVSSSLVFALLLSGPPSFSVPLLATLAVALAGGLGLILTIDLE